MATNYFVIDAELVPEPAFIASQFNSLYLNLSNDLAPLEESRTLIAQEAGRRFDTEGASDGEPWEAWKKGRQDPLGHGTILDLGGYLRDFAESKDTYQIVGHDIMFDPQGMPEYGEYHQRGATSETIPNWKLPARPWAGVSEEMDNKIYGVFQDWFNRTISVVTRPSGAQVIRSKVTGRILTNLGKGRGV